MINQTHTRRLDAEKIRQDFIRSKKLDIILKPRYPKVAQAAIQKPSN